MQEKQAVERLVGVIGDNDYYTKEVATALLLNQPYEQVFELVPGRASFNAQGWSTISRIHEMVVAFKPHLAHRWLNIAAQPLLSSESNRCSAYVRGSILGFLGGGTWIDENWKLEPLEYSEKLPLMLARILCGPAKLDLEPLEQDAKLYRNELCEAMRAYFFPHKTIDGRDRQVAEAVAYICEHGRPENFGYLDELIIERLCHGVLASRSAREKVVGIHLLLKKFAPILD